MIRRLAIFNLGIIDSLVIDFKEGFTVLTGETGSGKSLILGAIALLFSPKVSSSMIKGGKDFALIEGVFDISSHHRIRDLLEEYGFPVEDELVIKRKLSSKGKGRIFVNQVISNTKFLSLIKGMLVEIQSQRDLKILDSSYQLELLDRFAGVCELVSDFRRIYAEYKRVLSDINEVEDKNAEIRRKIDYLNFAVSEIEKVKPDPDEEKRLLKEKEFLVNVERLKEALEASLCYLSQGEISASSLIKEALRSISNISHLDSRVDLFVSRLNEIVSIIDDLVFDMTSYFESLDVDSSRLEEVENRLTEFYKLKLKYGKSIEDVLNFYNKSLEELRELEKRLSSIGELKAKAESLYEKLNEIAIKLSGERKKAARILANRVVEELKELGFENPIFQIILEGRKQLTASGYDECCFCFSANPDVEPRPLDQVVSGGELSRIIIALKSIFSDMEDIPTLVLDEVDSGIGGKTADLVGHKLRSLGNKKQILCVTHFPQVASKAHHHIKVDKILKGGRTFVSVAYISGKKREEEFDRMMGSIAVGEDGNGKN